MFMADCCSSSQILNYSLHCFPIPRSKTIGRGRYKPPSPMQLPEKTLGHKDFVVRVEYWEGQSIISDIIIKIVLVCQSVFGVGLLSDPSKFKIHCIVKGYSFEYGHWLGMFVYPTCKKTLSFVSLTVLLNIRAVMYRIYRKSNCLQCND